MKLTNSTSFSLATLAATLGLCLASATPAFAVTTSYLGDFQLNPRAMHPSPITGKMTLAFTDDQITAVTLNLDHPIFGLSKVPSREQWSTKTANGSALQIPVAFLLKGPPHSWYFVFLGTSVDGGATLQGSIYRADATMAAIQAAVRANPATPPASWKVMGNAVLKAQQ